MFFGIYVCKCNSNQINSFSSKSIQRFNTLQKKRKSLNFFQKSLLNLITFMQKTILEMTKTCLKALLFTEDVPFFKIYMQPNICRLTASESRAMAQMVVDYSWKYYFLGGGTRKRFFFYYCLVMFCIPRIKGSRCWGLLLLQKMAPIDAKRQ